MPVPVFLAVKAAGMALADYLPEILSSPLTLRAALYVARMYRIIGTGSLLSDGDVDGFATAVSHGAHAYAAFLTGAPDAEKVTGKSEPFFDALAAGNLRAATRIANDSRDTLNPGKEYEESFYYHLFVMQLFLVASPARLEGLLKEYAAFGPDARYSLCEALFTRDQDAFDQAFAEALAEKRKELGTMSEKKVLSPDEAATVAHVSTEVLAWTVLAGGRGLAVPADCPLAPSLARNPVTVPPHEDAWKQPEDYRDLE